jgi:hypothetical protein
MRTPGGNVQERSKSVVSAAVFLLVVNVASLHAQEATRAGAYSLEGLGALGGVVGCGCLAAGGWLVVVGASMWGSDPRAIGWVGGGAALVSATALPAAAGYGAAKAGEQLGEDGSETGAIVREVQLAGLRF